MSLPLPAGVIFVDDIERMAAFYEGVAALTRATGDERHVVLESAAFQLTIHALPASYERASSYPLREDTAIKLCLPVSSLNEARERAASLGGRVFEPDREWRARGFRACDGHDPEGNVFQLREAD